MKRQRVSPNRPSGMSACFHAPASDRTSSRARQNAPAAVLSADDLERHLRTYLLDCEIRGLAPYTNAMRARAVGKLAGFLRERQLPCDRDALREFFAYVRTGATRPANCGAPRPPKPRTVEAYFVDLGVFFNHLVAEGTLAENPLAALPKPVARQDQVRPFTQEQVAALLDAARRSALPKRNEAILLFLLDSGCRVSEVCGLQVKDLDFNARCCSVRGKGNKSRRVYFSATTHRSLWRYLEGTPHAQTDPLFLSERGMESGAGITRNGVLLLCRRLGKAAGITAARCSPHTCRHTFAVNFLRAGGNVFTLKELLGHTTLVMVNRYVALAEADLEAQHRMYSPVEMLLGGRR